ncbi:hypothetical protein CGCFRS4_v012400 [Colletotrichum fructicola]|nr:hypothetical protein CGCFRS4_v012400 [Colletotrichum fructicola]KAF4936299.1 hypothetical protein CGCF245_v006715 [Colletotrichum fructicola]
MFHQNIEQQLYGRHSGEERAPDRV